MATGEIQKAATESAVTDRTRSNVRVEGPVSRSVHLSLGDELLPRVRRLARRQRNLLDRLSRAEELADALTLEVGELEAALLRVSAGALPNEQLPGSAPSQPEAARLLQGTAAAGVRELVIKRHADGSARVSVDGGKAFSLPPALGDLLAVLAVDSGLTADQLIGWKTLDEVTILLSRKTGRTLSRHAVSQTVYRLRKAVFERGGVNPYLIQTSRRHGLRFALQQRKDAAVSRVTDVKEVF